MYRIPLAACLLALFGASAALAQDAKPAMPPAHGQMAPGHMDHMDHMAMSHGAAPKDDQALIASAMTAAPAAVSSQATIIDVGEDGAVRVLRKGPGAFTCMADNPTTPGPDPMCLDANALEWAKAWMGRQPPPQKVGFMYMLAGGADASNTDPYAKAPDKANHWVKTGPHVMIVGDAELLKSYPAGADPDTTQPYVMWGGTPYAHLMIPVR
jgi:hypothetical protein